jgi:hypothetical protein
MSTFLLAASYACSSSEEPKQPGPSSSFCAADAGAFTEGESEAPATPLVELAIEGSGCAAVERQYAVEASPHLPDCSAVSYATNPPSSGPHYGTWAAYQVYEEPVPHGFLVHSLEHGGVVFFYSCTDCADEVARARAVIDALPVDAACASTGVSRRLILTPDPLLSTRWAAAAWGVTLQAECFEEAVFDAFARTHYAQGAENICGGGTSGDR